MDGKPSRESKVFAYSKERRLRSRSDYLQCSKRKNSFVIRNCTVFYRQNNFGYARLGCSVSKKQGIAVQRNLFRRRLKEAFRTNLKLRALSFDFHIMPLMNVSGYSFQDLQELFTELLRISKT